MLIVMTAHATETDINRVRQKIESLGFRAHIMPGAQKTAIGITGNPGPIDPAEFEDLPGVAEAIREGVALPPLSRRAPIQESVRGPPQNTVRRRRPVPVPPRARL